MSPNYAGRQFMVSNIVRTLAFIGVIPHLLIPLGQRSLVDQQSNGSIKCGPRYGSEGAANTYSSDSGIGQIRNAHVGADQQNIDGFRCNG